MATRDLIVDFTRGTGGEPVYGYVTVQRTVDTENGAITLLPFIQRYELRDGTVTIPALVTNGSPPVYNSGYRIYAYDYQNRPQGGVLVAIPDGTGTVNVNDLPRVTLTNGDGATVDIEQLNALIQQANDTANSVRADLDSGRFGNATVLVDNTAGKRVFITDGTTETMISGDTGWRDLSSLLLPGVVLGVGGLVRIRRCNDRVTLKIRNMTYTSEATENYFLRGYPIGFRGTSGTVPANVKLPINLGFDGIGDAIVSRLTGMTVRANQRDMAIQNRVKTPQVTEQYDTAEVSWVTGDVWPTASDLSALPLVS